MKNLILYTLFVIVSVVAFVPNAQALFSNKTNGKYNNKKNGASDYSGYDKNSTMNSNQYMNDKEGLYDHRHSNETNKTMNYDMDKTYESTGDKVGNMNYDSNMTRHTYAE